MEKRLDDLFRKKEKEVEEGKEKEKDKEKHRKKEKEKEEAQQSKQEEGKEQEVPRNQCWRCWQNTWTGKNCSNPQCKKHSWAHSKSWPPRPQWQEAPQEKEKEQEKEKKRQAEQGLPRPEAPGVAQGDLQNVQAAVAMVLEGQPSGSSGHSPEALHAAV